MRWIARWGGSIVALALFAGCNEEKVEVYTVPREVSSAPAPTDAPTATAATTTAPATQPPGAGPLVAGGGSNTPMAQQALPPGATVGSGVGNPAWEVPPTWQPGLPAPQRRASFVVTGPEGQRLDISVTVFPGDVGGELANINRWRGQLGLPPISAVDLPTAVERWPSPGQGVALVEFGGPAPAGRPYPVGFLAAIVPHRGNTWFVRVTGDAPLVSQERDNFRRFVASWQLP